MRALTRSLASVFVVAGPPPWPSQRGHQPSPKLVPRRVGENKEVKAVTDRPRLSLTFVSLRCLARPPAVSTAGREAPSEALGFFDGQ